MDYYRLKLTKSKLKAISGTSSLMSGFAMVAMVELSLDYESYFESAESAAKNKAAPLIFETLNSTYENFSNETSSLFNESLKLDETTSTKKLIPEFVLVLYVFITCLLVGVHMLALMISTCILPQVEATTEQMEFERNLKKFEKKHLRNESNKERVKSLAPEEEENNLVSTFFDSDVSTYPHQKFHRFVEMAWLSSTVVGIFLFIIEISLICFIKFYPISIIAALTGTLIMIPILLIFIYFTFAFYKKVADFKLYVTKQFYNHVDRNCLHEHVV